MLRNPDPSEKKERLRNFRMYVQTVDEINDDLKLGYSAAINFISVMTDQEYQDLLNLRMNETMPWGGNNMAPPLEPKVGTIPDAVDWVKRGYTTPIKDQAGCASCWAFGAVSALEGNYFILTGDLVSFSEQQYLDCTYTERDGCNGGWMDDAYGYTLRGGQMAKESDYKYSAYAGTCKLEKTPNAMIKANLVRLDHRNRGNDRNMARELSQSVLTVAIKVVASWNTYRTG